MNRRALLKLMSVLALAGLPPRPAKAEGLRVVVAGAGIVGASIAWHLTRTGARVTVIDKEEVISYGACGMPYNIEDPDRSIDDLVVLQPEDAREKRGIDLRLRHEAKAIDLERRVLTVRTSSTK